MHGLRLLGRDVLTTHDAGRSGQSISDEQVLANAVAEQRGVLTLNRKHFIRLHRLRPDHAGIVVCTVDSDFSALAHRIHTAIVEATEIAGQLIRVTRPQTAERTGGAPPQDV